MFVICTATDEEAAAWVDTLKDMIPDGVANAEEEDSDDSFDDDNGGSKKKKGKGKGKGGKKKALPYPPDRPDTVWCSVNVRKAKELIAKDITGTSDPYVIITVQEPDDVDKKVK